jgi:hypothetical protein
MFPKYVEKIISYYREVLDRERAGSIIVNEPSEKIGPDLMEFGLNWRGVMGPRH